MNNPLGLYKKYHQDREDERLGLFLELNKKYSINKALYLGSFVHVTPSFVFPHVVYVDSYKQADGFYKSKEVIEFIAKNKQSAATPKVVFHYMDYTKDFGEEEETFDLLISQYAGFVSQAGKKYLKKGGILVANNSHGDASMAFLDSDYEFIGVYNKRKSGYSLSDKDLGSYFIPKKPRRITKSYLQRTQRGVGYTKSPSGYIFRKW